MQRIKMYYDPRGQVIRTVNPDNTQQRVVYGVPITLSEVEGFTPSPWETYSYDANDLDTSSPHYATPKSAEVDALGRTIKTLDRLESSDSTSNNVQMLYDYDIRGNLLNVKDAYDRTVFERIYDLQTPAKEGESIPPLKTTHINKGTSTVVFDCTGKPVETRDEKGALTLHGYDVLQRPIKMWCKDNNSEATTLRQNSIFGDNADQNNNGKLVEHFDEGGYEKIDNYDFKGNVLQKSKQVINNNEILNAIQNSQDTGWGTIACYRVDWTGLNIAILSSTVYQTNMEYDGLNRLKKITYPADTDNSRKELIPLYNKAGALQKVQFDGTEYVKEIAYNAKGQRLLIAYGNGLMTRYCYNEKTFRLSRLKTEGYTYGQNGNEHSYDYNSGTTKQDFAYTYDKGGNIISINDVTPQCGVGASDELRRDFTYDALYRLLSATGRDNKPSVDFPRWDDTTRSDDPNNTKDYTQTYSYDLMGNINELQHQGENNFTRSFDYKNNLLNSIAVGGNNYTFEYDVCGNQTKENQERQFNWDYADRLKLYYNQVNPGQEPSTYAHYLYDAGGNRVKKLTRTQGGGWECITYIDGLIEYREDHNGQQQSISHIMDDSKRIASIRKGHDFEDTTPEVKYNMDDHLGSSNLSVDENGTLVNREEYYPFGETSFGSYSKKRYRFCGKEKDEESGLYYYGARYYSPWTCRFISVDPLAGKYIFQTPYAYADNNPICKLDYNGEGTDGGPNGEKPAATTPNQTPTPNKPVLPQSLVNKLSDTTIPGTGKNADYNYSKVEVIQKKIDVKKTINNLSIARGQATVKADNRSDEQIKSSVKRAEDFYTSIEIANTISELPLVGPILDPVVSISRAGMYNGMDMPEKRNTELLRAGVGIGILLVTEGLASNVTKVGASVVEEEVVAETMVAEEVLITPEVNMIASPLRFEATMAQSAERLGFFTEQVTIQDGVAEIPITYMSSASIKDMSAVLNMLKANGANSVNINSGPIINTSISSRLLNAANQGKEFMGFKVFNTGNPNNMFILSKKL